MIRPAPLWRLLPLLVIAIPWTLPRPTLAEEAKEIALLAGNLDAWETPHGAWEFVREVSLRSNNPKQFEAKAGSGDVLYNGPTGRSANLLSRESFGDVALHIEFNVAQGSNSGVKLHGVYEIQIYDSWNNASHTGRDCGGIYPRSERRPRYHRIDDGYAPMVNASKAPGEWQTLEIVFQAPRFDDQGNKILNARFVKVVHNGQIIHEDQEVPFPTGNNWRNQETAVGPILLQGDHGPIAFRNIRAQPLKLSTALDQDKSDSDSSEINRQFQDPDVQRYVDRFESDSREVFAKRREIAKVIGLEPGMTIIDVGAGTGFFSRLFAEEVGPKGLVVAADISRPFLRHIDKTAREQGLENLRTAQSTQTAIPLPASSADRIFLADVYHHFEDHEAMLASFHRTLKPDGQLVLVEFDRREGKSSKFVLGHVRADRETFIGEIEAAGFTLVPTPDAPKLKENFIAVFRKTDATKNGKAEDAKR